MSRLKDNRSNDNDRKSSNIIIISKSRLSSAKNRGNYMTIQEGELRFTIKMNHEPVNKRTINQTITSMRRDMIKNSQSYVKLDSESRKLDLYLNKKGILCSPYKERDSKERDSFFNKNKEIKKIKLKSRINVETTISNKLNKTTEVNIFNKDNKDMENYHNNNLEDEFKIKNIDLISDNSNKENNLSVKDINDIKKNENKNEENIINIINNEYNINKIIIDLKDVNNNNKKINVNPKNYLSQNYVNNFSNKDKKIKKILPIDTNKSEEINKKNSFNFNENDSKRDYNKEKNVQPSDITMNDQVSKNILGSLRTYLGGEFHENENINIHNLMTENEEDDNLSKNTVKSKNELISQNKSLKIDEEESVEVEEDEYDEKVKENNNTKLISSSNKKNIFPNVDNEISHYNNEKCKIVINEFKNKNNSDIKSLNLNQNTEITYKMCFICEHTYPMTKIFVAKCNEHFICKRCAKNYFEEIIEEGKNNEILCPFLKCREPIEFSDLKNIINQEHYNRLFLKNKNNFYFTKLKTNIDKKNIEKYSKKNVIDINSNKNIFNYNSEKERYCPFCYKKSLFLKTNNHYYKCLNCLCKICKHCFKEYDERHLDLNYIHHCKVYYRMEIDANKTKYNNFILFLIEILFVCAIFYLCFAGSFLLIRQMFFYLFNIRRGRNIIKFIFIYFFTIIIFIITIPFIFLLYPYFPSIISIFEY